MGKKLNLKEGDIFNRLTLLKIYVIKDKNGHKGLWKCSCGIEKLYTNSKVVSGHTNSCGCYRSDQRILINTKHGYSKKYNTTSEYKTWQKIKDRCLNTNNQDYIHYGGRGINICNEWLDFKIFIKDMGNKPDKNYSIERIDFNLGYFKENCKWILKKLQSKNRRNSIFVNVNNKIDKICLKEACQILNLNYMQTLYQFRKTNTLPQNIKLLKNIT